MCVCVCVCVCVFVCVCVCVYVGGGGRKGAMNMMNGNYYKVVFAMQCAISADINHCD